MTGCIEQPGDGTPVQVGDLCGALGTGAVELEGSLKAVVNQPATMSTLLGDRALRSFPPMPPPFVSEEGKVKAPDAFEKSAQKESESVSFVGRPISELGGLLVRWFMEVSPLRSQSTGRGISKAVFPLPTSIELFRDLWPSGSEQVWQWMVCVCSGLNSFWGGPPCNVSKASELQRKVMRGLYIEVERFCELGLKSVGVDWTTVFAVRGIDYKGEEVKVAKWVTWANIGPALPKEIGAVPLEEVCSLGCREYVESFDRFLKPCNLWGKVTQPKVMVEDAAWGEMRAGLVKSGVCCYLEESEVFHIGSTPLLNGLFGVSKEEWTPENVEICRLIMNLVPLNELCEPLGGDVDTLPSWGMMNPYFLQPNENLLISSEDVKCFFYTMQVPRCWTKFLTFNQVVPDHVLPPELQGHTTYLASRVLPMGCLNSVSIAQHVHRNLVRWSTVEGRAAHVDEAELRKDRSFTVANPCWRVYLDNYDVLEKVEATGMVEVEGTVPGGILALRQEYERWEIPRNEKKAVERSSRCELQGATVDGLRGVAIPKEAKQEKYFSLAITLVQQRKVSQRQMQVVCGGLVYFSMFRRPMLGTLNAVWRFIESFNNVEARYQVLPRECKLELIRYLCLMPLVRMDFRTEVHPMVTCSDASLSGGGVCCSSGLTSVGTMAVEGGLRGERPQPLDSLQVVVIGLFDGIGALRVATELQGVSVLGYVSVEKEAAARRVVESHYPGVLHYDDVAAVQDEDVRGWSLKFSEGALVLIGAGPPCQGVSGLNADRKGALRDARSCLYVHVSRITQLVKGHFRWCQVHTLMESVSSMDQADRDHMSRDFGAQPVHIDAGNLSWCHRPRLYWCTWELVEGEGATLDTSQSVTVWWLVARQELSEVVEAGWDKVVPTASFPTFTTSRPSSTPGRKPAGLRECAAHELKRWSNDLHRFPPYQYMDRHRLVNRQGELRVPTVAEREVMLGFPAHYTAGCCSKGDRKKEGYLDRRLTLLGNSSSVPVVGWLLSQLISRLVGGTPMTPQEVVDKIRPGTAESIQGRLVRLPLRRAQPGAGSEQELAFKLCNMVSVKGEDILLTTPSTQLVKFHRLRATIPAKLWRCVVTGWKWRHGKEHINSLELRAILNSVRWRIEHCGHINRRMLHLTDSLVCLHALTRGRTSSRRLRATMSRINALVLCSNAQFFWAYVSTDTNPADKPSRWGSRVKTKFRNASANFRRRNRTGASKDAKTTR